MWNFRVIFSPQRTPGLLMHICVEDLVRSFSFLLALWSRYLFCFILLNWNYQVFGFLKFVRTSSLLFKDKRRYHNNKTQKKKCNNVWLQVTDGQNSCVLPKCFNDNCRFQSLVTTTDYKCQYYLNKSNSMEITISKTLHFLFFTIGNDNGLTDNFWGRRRCSDNLNWQVMQDKNERKNMTQEDRNSLIKAGFMMEVKCKNQQMQK